MWPTLLNISRDDCQQTLRRLELEAYANVVDVFRAQGALEDTRKKILEDLRAVLHISKDRHSAEARRVANDELLATIAAQLTGPNTGLGWICEGRRLVPLLPRGVPQTMYTDIADSAAEELLAEEKLKQAEEKLRSQEALQDDDVEMADADAEEEVEESSHPPVAMEDPVAKIWETEVMSRKRRGAAAATAADAPAVKTPRNIPPAAPQRHLNLSAAYSKFSQPLNSKPSSQSKHSYNQISKVSSGKSSHAPRERQSKPRAKKEGAKRAPKGSKKSLEAAAPTTPTKLQMDYAPGTFQASYAQSLLGKSKSEYINEMKPELTSSPPVGSDSPPAPPPAPPDDAAPQPPPPPAKHTVSGKPCQLIIKKRGEITAENKPPPNDARPAPRPGDGVRLIASRPVVVTSQKVGATPGKVMATKIIGHLPRAAPRAEKVVVVAKASEHSVTPNSKAAAASAHPACPAPAGHAPPKVGETITAKGIPATDIKVSSAKTFLLNPKSGQKMVVVPAKPRPKPGEGPPMPLLHLKGIPKAMRLVPVNSQPSQVKASVTVVSKNATPSIVPSNAKVISVEPIKTANMADIVPVKGLAPAARAAPAVVRPTGAKGNVIVVQKGTPIGKALAINKGAGDMSKIIMGKNVNKLLQANKMEASAAGGGGGGGGAGGDVIVLELNDEAAHTTTMSEILDARGARAGARDVTPQKITEDTPVLFDTRMSDETCNASSLDSAAESIGDLVPMEAIQAIVPKDKGGAGKPTVDWELELDRKAKDEDKLNSLHLDLGMSSDSDSDYMGERHKAKRKHSPAAAAPGQTPSEVGGMTLAARTLLSQLQDEGSSSNDSSFTLRARAERPHEPDPDLTKVKEKLTEKVARSQRRIDLYSTAISSAEINLDSFSYLEEGMMAGDAGPLGPLDDPEPQHKP